MNTVLVKLFELNHETVNEKGVVDIAFEAGYSEGNKPQAKRSERRFQAKGEVIMVSPTAKDYIETQLLKDHPTIKTISKGDIILIDQGAISVRTEYIINREQPVAGGDGYYLVNVAEIQSIETLKN